MAIVLCPRNTSRSFDDAGISIIKSVLPEAPYESVIQGLQPPPLTYVPPLAYFCIRRLVEYPDAAQFLGDCRLRYTPTQSHQKFDILRALIPAAFHSNEHFGRLCLCTVDPRLWALLIQCYTNLPEQFRRFILPLGDPNLPLLHHIPSTANFFLLTILDLPKCNLLTDDTILEFKILHGLCALDASATPLTAHGIQRLGWTLSKGEIDSNRSITHKGPWGLRILRLQNCKGMDDSIFASVSNFLLLCVLDVRGTKCTRNARRGHFRPCTHRTLFYPTTISESLKVLINLSDPDALFSHPDPFFIHVNALSYSHAPPRRSSKPARAVPDIFTFLPIKQEQSLSMPPYRTPPSTILATNPETPTRVPTTPSQLLSYLLYELERMDEEARDNSLDIVLRRLQEQGLLTTLNSDLIGEEEGNRDSSLQSLQRFYGTTVTANSERHECRYTKVNEVQHFESDPRSSSNEELFMLFRDQPPWKRILESPLAKPSSSKLPSHDASFIARVDRANKKAKHAAGGIVDMIAERKNTDKTSTAPRPNNKIKIQQSKNPFVRKPSAQSFSLTARLNKTSRFSST